MHKGVIKKMVADKGFGFIKAEGREKDLFFHATAVVDGLDFKSLREGEEVVFTIANTDKGDAAVEVDLA